MAAPVLSAAHSPTPASFAVPMAPLPLPTTSLSWVPPQVPANPHPPPPLSLICLRYHFEGGSEADEWLRPCVYLTHEQLLQCVEHQGFDIALVQPSLQPSLYTSATILSSRGCCVSRRRQFQAWPPLHIQTCIRARCLLHIIILHVPVSLPLPLPVCNTNTEP